MRRWIAIGGIILLVVASVAGFLAFGSGSDANSAPKPSGLVSHVKGVVTEDGIVGLPFGVTAAVAEASLGAPGEFTSTLHPTPTLRQGGKWWGFHCARRNNHPCHTYFGFVNGRFTTFCTQSAQYRTPNGSHPGLSMAKARRDPGPLRHRPGGVCVSLGPRHPAACRDRRRAPAAPRFHPLRNVREGSLPAELLLLVRRGGDVDA